MTEFDPHNFDFDDWAKIARQDPERFEALRREAVESLIDSAPAHQRRRLQGLQWTIDRERERSSNPIAACIRLSDLMWERLAGEGGLLEALTTFANQTTSEKEPRPSATVLQMSRPDDANDEPVQ